MYKYKVIFIFITGQNTETESLSQKVKLTHKADQGLKLPFFFFLIFSCYLSYSSLAKEHGQGRPH